LYLQKAMGCQAILLTAAMECRPVEQRMLAPQQTWAVLLQPQHDTLQLRQRSYRD
jgi:hypothetical protein